MLPEQPHVQLFDDLIAVGILQKQRITQTIEDVYKDETGVWGNIYKQLEKKKPRILLNKSTVIPIGDYLNEKCAPSGAERSRVIANGLRLLTKVEEPNPWKYYIRLFCALLPLALLVVGALALIFSPIVAIVALVVLAAVGTTLFFMSLYAETQRTAAITDISEEDEIHIVQDCHKTAVREDLAQRRGHLITQTLVDTLSRFADRCSTALLDGAIVTMSDEEAEYAKQLIHQSCTMESEHAPLLREGISAWTRMATARFETESFDLISNPQATQQEVEKELRECAEKFHATNPPSAIFAFASRTLADVNTKLKFAKMPKLKTKLSFEDYWKDKSLTESELKPNSLSNVLSDSIRALIDPILEEEKTATIQPTAHRLSSLLNGNRIGKGVLQPNSATVKTRSQQHSSEQLLSGERAVQILSADLHRVLLRVAFHSLTPELLGHMVRYNYPLSRHCAQRLFDATIYLLEDIGEPVDQLQVVVKRGTHNVLKYSVTLSTKDTLKKLILELHEECFFVVERPEHKALKNRNPIGLFEALREKFPRFADRYLTEADLFVTDLATIVESRGEAKSTWKRHLDWTADEKLLCKMAV